MSLKGKLLCLGVLFALVGVLCAGAARGSRGPEVRKPVSVSVPNPSQEFRGLWVATVENIDWPSRRPMSSQDQKAELRAIMDRAVKLNFNAIVLQVRPSCDALYSSKLEPWSEYISGKMGEPPQPYYDPLAFAVEEAHKRGLELHAWFNPFRVRLPSGTNMASANHISKAHPELVRSYGNYLWLDPTDQRVRAHSLKVIMDVVRRYDIDGVHFDDYFFPYKVKDVDFPDEANWKSYLARGGKLSRSDWRRDSVNLFVRGVYTSIKGVKPWVRFGISPFGIWQPSYPAQIKGYNAYENLYADSRKWLASGWVDYLSPQLYWSISAREQSFPVLLKWWTEQSKMGRPVWPGFSQAAEAAEQVALTRKLCVVPGTIFWHAKTLMQNSNNVVSLFGSRAYTSPALVPDMPWLSRSVPVMPVVSGGKSGAGLKVNWRRSGGDVPIRWVIQARYGGRWTTEVVGGDVTSRVYPDGRPLPEVVSVRAVNRFGAFGLPAAYSGK